MARPRPVVGLLSGVAAGLAASAAMHLFQKLAERAPQTDDAALPAVPNKANDVIPYAVGAALGGMYGLLGEYQPDAGTGFATAYGVATAALIDKVAPAPTSDAPAHGVVSHLVFGAVLEGVRTLIAGRR